MKAAGWPDVLTNSLAAVYRVDQADPTWRRAREVVRSRLSAGWGRVRAADASNVAEE